MGAKDQSPVRRSGAVTEPISIVDSGWMDDSLEWADEGVAGEAEDWDGGTDDEPRWMFHDVEGALARWNANAMVSALPATARLAPVREARVREARLRDAPSGDGRLRDGPAGNARVREARLRDAPAGDGPLRDGPAGNARVRDGSLRDLPLGDASAGDAPFLGASDDDSDDWDDAGAEGGPEGPADFCAAAVRLARAKPRSNTAIKAAREAAQALRDLALARDEAALRRYLRPDPDQVDVTWTVACYQIGDLTPCTLKDFANPVAAVKNLANCGQASHLAAELVASTPSGTRWTAVIRTADQLNFQLPSEQSAATGPDSGSALAAAHWREQLIRWEAGEAAKADRSKRGPAKKVPAKPPGKSAKAASAAGASAAARVPAKAASVPAKAAPATGGPTPRTAAQAPRPQKFPPRPATAASTDGLELERALEMVVATLHRVELTTRQAEQPDGLVLSRLEALDRRLSDFEVAFEAALDRRIHALARYTAELTRALTEQQQAVNAKLEARLDEVLASLPRPPGPGAEGSDEDEPSRDH